MSQLHKLLQDRGLTPKEAAIYLAGLELGVVPASVIAKTIKENRITVYSALQAMCKVKVAVEMTKNRKKFYMMTPPEELLSKEKDKCAKFEKVLPELLAIANASGGSNKPKVMYYEGLEGIKKIYEDHLSSKSTIHAILGGPANKQLEDYFQTHMEKRQKMGIRAKIIASADDSSKEYAKEDKRYNKETLLINDASFKMTNEITIYNENKVSIQIYSKSENNEDMSGVIIENKGLHDSILSLVEYLRKAKGK